MREEEGSQKSFFVRFKHDLCPSRDLSPISVYAPKKRS